MNITRETEAGFTAAVIDYARLMGWRVAHFRPGRTAKGWRTPVSGDGAGFPDLVMLRGNRVVVAELKVGKNLVTREQEAWLVAWRLAGANVYTWRPSDWPRIRRALGGQS